MQSRYRTVTRAKRKEDLREEQNPHLWEDGLLISDLQKHQQPRWNPERQDHGTHGTDAMGLTQRNAVDMRP